MHYYEKRVESIKQNMQKYIDLLVAKYILDTNHTVLQDYQTRLYARMDALQANRKQYPTKKRNEPLFAVYLAYSDLLFYARMALGQAQNPKMEKIIKQMEKKEIQEEQKGIQRDANIKKKVEAWKIKKARKPPKEVIEVNITVATLDDVEDLVHLLYLYQAENQFNEAENNIGKKYKQFIMAHIASTDKLFFVAKTNVGELVGFAFLSTVVGVFASHYRMTDLFVCKKMRGNSIATALVQGIADYFTQHGLGTFDTEVLSNNKVANHLFITHGFFECQPVKKYWYYGSSDYTQQYLGY